MLDSTSPELAPASPATPTSVYSTWDSPERYLGSPASTSLYIASPAASPERYLGSPASTSLHVPPVLSPPLWLTDEATSRRRKRQRVEEEEEEEGEVIKTNLPRNLLECPVCFHALTIPTFQCDNGHIACSSCCTKLSNICPTCKVPTGKIRCRFAESVVEASIVPCPNAKHGCAEKFSYGKELAHQEECSFALCYCPAPNCNYRGMYEDLYNHCNTNHQDVFDYFDFGIPCSIFLYDGMKDEVIQEYRDGSLVVVQCFKVERGMQVSVNCIAPCAPEVEKLSYRISYSCGHHTVEFGPVEMNRIQKVSLQNPEKGSCMFVPDYFLSEEYRDVEMLIWIRWLNEEDGYTT